MAINTNLSTITLSFNGLNGPIKRHRVADWRKQQEPILCCLQKIHLRAKDSHRFKVRGMKNHIPGKQRIQESGGHNTHFRKNRLKNKDHKEGQYIMIKGGFYMSQQRCTQYRHTQIHKQILTDIKGNIDKTATIIGDFNTPLTSADRYSRQKINKATKIPLVQQKLDLTDIFKTLHPQNSEYTFFSSAHGTLSRTDHTLRNKTNLNNFKSLEIISISFLTR